MVQAALPDLNTQWIMSKREAWTAIKNKDYNSLFGALFDINAMLPKDKDRDYQIEISDHKYNEMIKQDTIYICNSCSSNCIHCKTNEGKCIAETPKNVIVIKNIPTSSFIRTLTGKHIERMWQCPRCKEYTLLHQTKIIQTVIKEPFFLKVVPSPPSRKNGIMDRREYDRSVKRWAMILMNELSYQMSRYRLEYIPKDSEQKDEEVLDGQEHLDNF